MPTPDPDLRPETPPPKAIETVSTTKFEGFGIKCEAPLPKFVVAISGILLTLAAVGIVSYVGVRKFSGGSIRIVQKDEQIVPKDQQATYEASRFHMQKLPDDTLDSRVEDFTLDDGTKVTVNHFHKDGCVQIVRWNNATKSSETKWLFGLNAHSSANAQPVKSSKLNLVPEAQAQGRCMDPHPGPFQYSNQPVNQCLIQVWRYFGDGCVHYQFYNPCTGTWDVFQNGAPHVYWTRCIH